MPCIQRRASCPQKPRVLPALGCLAAALLLAGCDASDPSQQAIDTASIQLDNIAIANPIPDFGVERLAKQYADVLALLKPVAESGLPRQNAAVSSLISRAHIGLGRIAADDAARAERRALDAIAAVRARYSVFTSHSAIAAGLETYNPAAELVALDAQIADRERDLAAARSSEDKLVAQAADLESQAKATLAKASALRDDAAAQRARLASLSQVERLAVVEQIRTVSREADALDARASDLAARAAQVAPLAEPVRIDIAKFQSQIEMLVKAKADIAARRQTYVARAAEARSTASTAAAQVAELAATLDSTARGAALTEPTAKAISEFNLAIADARKAAAGATGETKAAATSTAAAAQLALADALLLKARGIAAHHDLAATLAASDPALPQAADYAQSAAALKPQLDEALAAAREALNAAKDSFESTQAKGKTKDQLDALTASLQNLIDGNVSVSLRAAPNAKPSTPDEEAADDPAPADSADGPDTAAIRALITTLADATASGDFTAFTASVHADTPAAEALVQFIEAVAPAQARLDAACRDKLGKSLAELLSGGSGNNMVGSTLSAVPGAGATIDPASAVISVSGDSATATIPGSAQPLSFVRVADDWKFSFAIPDDPASQQQFAMLPMIGPVLTKAFGDLSDQVNDGSITDAEQLLAALQQAFMSSPLLGGGRGGPGGG